MIQITPHMRILLAVEPVDFRKGIDGLAALCRQALASDPQAGALFVFCSCAFGKRAERRNSSKSCGIGLADGATSGGANGRRAAQLVSEGFSASV
jgi:hypothetical protein